MWGGVEYEIQYQDCDDFYNWGGGGGGGGEVAARRCGVRFKEHIAITTASTTAVVDHLRCSGYMHLGYQPRLDSCERRGHVPLEWPSNIFSGPYVTQGRWLRAPCHLSRHFVK